MGFQLEQVQDFTPTPMTVATVIYYSGYHPYTMEPIFTAKTDKEKRAQNMYFFWHKPEFKQRIRDRLTSRGRRDLANQLLGEGQYRGKQFKKKTASRRTEKPMGRKPSNRSSARRSKR